MVKCADGGFVITCWTNSSGAGGEDVLLLKVNKNRTQEWNYTFGGPYDDRGYQVVNCKGGGFAIIGSYHTGS